MFHQVLMSIPWAQRRNLDFYALCMTDICKALHGALISDLMALPVFPTVSWPKLCWITNPIEAIMQFNLNKGSNILGGLNWMLYYVAGPSDKLYCDHEFSDIRTLRPLYVLHVSLLFALAGAFIWDRQWFVDGKYLGKSELLFQKLMLEMSPFSLYISFTLSVRQKDYLDLICWTWGTRDEMVIWTKNYLNGRFSGFIIGVGMFSFIYFSLHLQDMTLCTLPFKYLGVNKMLFVLTCSSNNYLVSTKISSTIDNNIKYNLSIISVC